jgi:hypothetical protein
VPLDGINVPLNLGGVEVRVGEMLASRLQTGQSRRMMRSSTYRTRHPLSIAGRKEYVESPQRLESQYTEGIERTKERLDCQREELREASKRRANLR